MSVLKVVLAAERPTFGSSQRRKFIELKQQGYKLIQSSHRLNTLANFKRKATTSNTGTPINHSHLAQLRSSRKNPTNHPGSCQPTNKWHQSEHASPWPIKTITSLSAKPEQLD